MEEAIVQIVITKMKSGSYKIAAMSKERTEVVFDGNDIDLEATLRVLVERLVHV